MSEWIDLTIGLGDSAPGWPDDVPAVWTRRMRIERGAPYNISMITLSMHSGTHVDAPLHFLRDGAAIDRMPIDAAVGPARIIEIEDEESIEVEELERHDVKAGERILLKTANSNRDWRKLPFQERYVHVSHEAAEHLAARKPRCIGIDYLSVGSFEPNAASLVHRTLLSAGIWLIESLYMAGVPTGPCDLVCLPLKVIGAEGAPCRAAVKFP